MSNRLVHVNVMLAASIAVCLSLSTGPARADVYNWAGPNGGNWNDSTDWTGGGGLFPGPADTARINLGLKPVINVNGAQSVGGLDFTNGSGVATSGTVSLNSGALTIGSAATVVAGQTLSGSASIIAPVNISGGTLAGPLSIHGNVTSTGGTIAPGITYSDPFYYASTLTVLGNVTLDHNTTLNFNLASPGTAGSDVNNLIDITGNLSLDGTFNVNALSGFGNGIYRLFNYNGTLTGAGLTRGTMPAGMGFTYTIDTSTTGQVNLDVYIWEPPWWFQNPAPWIDGTYAHFGDPYTSDWKWYPDTNPVGQEDVTYLLTHLLNTNYGDANIDRFTDFKDFQAILDHWQGRGGWADGDFNGDGVVDFSDFQILLDYWNPGGWSAGASQVPEPASLSLLLVAAAALLRRRRK